MFSLHQGNELVVQIPSISIQEPTIRQDLLVGLCHNDSSGRTTNTITKYCTRKKRRESTLTMTRSDPSKKEERNVYDDDGDEGGDSMKKRMMHREIERQRRQDMAKLYSSLRSLLPLEFIKGKRSISDHMNQAVNYIKHMQENIKHLNGKRDELKNMPNTSVVLGEKNIVMERSNNRVPNTITVSSCQGGVEILINSCYIEFLLSRLLKVLVQEGVSLVSYSSTKVNERLLQTIQCEVRDLTCINLSVLQQKLSEAVQEEEIGVCFETSL